MSALVCPFCRNLYVSASALYVHQVLTREITVSPYTFERIRVLADPRVNPRAAAKDMTSYMQV